MNESPRNLGPHTGTFAPPHISPGIDVKAVFDQVRSELPRIGGRFKLGDRVRKTKGSSWQGIVVGTYSTTLTPEGYCVESEREPGSVQIYPAQALELVKPATGGESGT